MSCKDTPGSRGVFSLARHYSGADEQAVASAMHALKNEGAAEGTAPPTAEEYRAYLDGRIANARHDKNLKEGVRATIIHNLREAAHAERPDGPTWHAMKHVFAETNLRAQHGITTASPSERAQKRAAAREAQQSAPQQMYRLEQERDSALAAAAQQRQYRQAAEAELTDATRHADRRLAELRQDAESTERGLRSSLRQAEDEIRTVTLRANSLQFSLNEAQAKARDLERQLAARDAELNELRRQLNAR